MVKLEKVLLIKEQYQEGISKSQIATYGGKDGHGNRVGAPVEYAALRIVSLSNEIEEDRKNLVTMLEEIGSVINRC